MNSTRKLLLLSVIGGLTTSGAFAAFDTLAVYGDAAGTTPPPSFTGDGSGTTAITAGGADFWGTSDVGGALLYDSTGTYTTTGDFTATVRHVSTTQPAPEWGRDGILVRADAGGVTPGAPEANDPTFMSFRKSNGQARAAHRQTRGGDYGELGGFDGPGVASNAYFLAAAREGNTMHGGAAMDIGTGGVPLAGRWVQTGTSTAAAFAGGSSLIVGLGHQSHYQTGGGAATGGVNIGTFDGWSFSGAYNPAFFGPAAGPATWSLGGGMNPIDPNSGGISGRAFVQQGGVATGEGTKWTIRAVDPTSLVPAFGVANATKRDIAADVNDIVPAANFRRSAVLTGLTADIYLANNPGTIAGARAIIDAPAPPNGTAIIPNVNWTGGTDSDANYNGLTGPASFAVATQPGNPDPASGAAGNFSGNQENYGVHIRGEIFIDSDANRQGQWANAVLFRDGIDDYTYLEIDGQVLLNDNDWQGYNATGNGGSHVTAMDVSDPKFDDGEWVPFEMIMWEGGGGDAGVLYSSMYDADGDFNNLAPLVASEVVTLTGSTQIGTESTDGYFGALPAGQWDVTLTIQNTGTSATFTQSLTVLVPEPTAPLLLGSGALGAFFRRRRTAP